MNNAEFYQALCKFKGGIEPLHETTAVLSYEAGRLLEYSMYMFWKGNDPAWRGFYKSELMDVIAQVILICEALDVDFDEWRELGIEKAMERFTKKQLKGTV